MNQAALYLLATFFFAQCLSQPVHSDLEKTSSSFSHLQSNLNPDFSATPQPFAAFTGRTLKNKVRIRLQPNLEAPILRESNKGDLWIVVGERDDFYALEAPEDLKGYVFRTYVLDNTIEGSRVNVRLEPHLDAPVIAQLQTGDKVNGQISALNNKWLEITPPASTHFYIAKEYIEKIGNADLKASLNHKRKEGISLLESTLTQSQQEFLKPWNQINLEKINEDLNKIINTYSDFPEIQGRARELLATIQEDYLQKKIYYLENLSTHAEQLHTHNKTLSSKVALQEQRIAELEQANQPKLPSSSSVTSSSYSADKMSAWLPVENQLYETWAEMHDNQPISAYYDEQQQQASTIKGIIQPYDRSVRNKPGDFVLLNPTTQIPMAYLYSTQVNLQNYLGRDITLKASPRNNNDFAYPAYFVLSIE
ncbi:SH3 domain-containing protein [Neochlamydia sp. AcF65]|uniref:SH3 domain-containing protein n=1 Tax=Neochlamydia sp. AcF65 TaxID=2795735 RepID=UPI001BCA3DC4|nr:SH3 domain-containing protein [Neochlamydia sp. AcF65]